MTKRSIRAVVIFVSFFLVLTCVAGYLLKISGKNMEYDLLKDFIPIVIAIVATCLAYCFQRRHEFLISLRGLWQNMVEAKGELVSYTHLNKPTQADFDKAHRAISRTIDLVRGVYKNVGETDVAIGLYPFEPLHDMRRAIEVLGFESNTPESQRVARLKIIQAWNALRCNFLKEFSTPFPSNPITERNAQDPRRMAVKGSAIDKS